MMTSAFIANQQELDFSRTLGCKLKSLSSEFLAAFQLSHAFVGKDYFNGNFFNISNDIGWKDITIECNYHKEFSKNFLQNIKTNSEKPLFFMWERDSEKSIKVLEHIYSHSGATSGFNILMPRGDHFENYGFASTKPIVEVYNNLPSREELEMFCLYLREELLNSPSLERPAFGDTGVKLDPAQDSKAKFHSPIPSSFSFLCNTIEAKLTQRELACLGLLVRGYSRKESAQILKISPRTVEFHLNQIKIKFNNPSKSELITKFNASPLSGVDPLFLMKVG